MPMTQVRNKTPAPRLYRVTSAARQQLILRGLLIIDRPGVTAAGSQLGDDCFVIVAAQTDAATRTTHTMVLALDPSAELLPSVVRTRERATLPSVA